ncbi:junction-mediating and -regulatory protein-like [Grus japonensis]|uniref:Junction-mediating and -regulatory protein-like n=1 Tax=Grus japonensis TaxID=30415 RepID=A0ABC9WQC1_GRUJA
MPAGSKMGPLLAKAKPISASVITYLRRKKQLERAFAVGERSEKMSIPSKRLHDREEEEKDEDREHYFSDRELSTRYGSERRTPFDKQLV